MPVFSKETKVHLAILNAQWKLQMMYSTYKPNGGTFDGEYLEELNTLRYSKDYYWINWAWEQTMDQGCLYKDLPQKVRKVVKFWGKQPCKKKVVTRPCK